jgi:hypothetical protein
VTVHVPIKAFLDFEELVADVAFIGLKLFVGAEHVIESLFAVHKFCVAVVAL